MPLGGSFSGVSGGLLSTYQSLRLLSAEVLGKEFSSKIVKEVRAVTAVVETKYKGEGTTYREESSECTRWATLVRMAG